MQRYDALVIGAGVNGLTAAAYLADAGLSVLVLERNSDIGGAAALGEFAPGFSAPRYPSPGAAISPAIVRDLDLYRHGLNLVRSDGGVSLFPDGRYVASYRNESVQRRELARHSHRDGDAWLRFSRDMQRAAAWLDPLLSEPPADPVARSFPGARGAASLLRRLDETGTEELYSDVRLWTLSIADYLDQYFESEQIKAHLAAPALVGAPLGPCAPATAIRLSSLWLGENGTSRGAPAIVHPQGGGAALAGALAGATVARGGEIRLDAEVTEITLMSGAATGVVLADGEEIRGRMILSDLDLKRSFLGLFQWKDLPENFVDAVGTFRSRGTGARLNLALDARPSFPTVPEDCPAVLGGLRIPGTFEQLEQASDTCMQREVPRTPLLDVSIPTLIDPACAPPDRHVMSVAIQYVPQEPRGGWTAERRERLAEETIDRLAVHSPGLKDLVSAYDLATPHDIEIELGIAHGDLSMGDMTPGQMFFNRPLPGCAGYRTPVGNYYLCSSSAHPGAALQGGPGANAARAAIRVMKAGR